MSRFRYVRLSRNGRNQAIRLPMEVGLPGGEAIVRRDGDRPIIEPPVRSKGLAGLLDSWGALDEAFPEIDDPRPAPKDIF